MSKQKRPLGLEHLTDEQYADWTEYWDELHRNLNSILYQAMERGITIEEIVSELIPLPPPAGESPPIAFPDECDQER